MALRKAASPDSPARDDDADGQDRWLGWLNAAAVLLLIVCFGMIALLFGLRGFMSLQMPAAQLAEIRQFMSEPVDFPAEWGEVRPWRPETLEAIEATGKEWDRSGSRTGTLWETIDTDPLGELTLGNSLSAEAWTTLSQILTESRALVEESSRTAALNGSEGLLSFPKENQTGLFWIEGASKSAWASAFSLAREGRHEEAVDFALLPLRFAQRHPASEGSVHYAAIGLERRSVRALATVTSGCLDSATLRNALRELVGMQDRLSSDSMSQADLLDSLGKLLIYKRHGYPVDLAPGRTKAYYLNQVMEAEYSFPQWMVDRLPAGDARRERFINMQGDRTEVFVKKLGCFLLPETVYGFMRTDGEYYLKEERVQRTRFGLLLLLLAERIMILEGRTLPAAPAGFVPEFLAEEPLDPFSGKPYLRDAVSGRYYSVGPDGKDDGLKIIYDGDGGGSDSGDVAVP